ncbi:carboxypeptidase regulatory-like domain-containing protein [Candidatus Palauibacter sp.]|uniref:carboxypeptidase regulatory-like domain-containing protein n=1 Tax=Candidatus Palauibacter sp. TaxID=3101350 RepID=UPI003B5C1507
MAGSWPKGPVLACSLAIVTVGTGSTVGERDTSAATKPAMITGRILLAEGQVRFTGEPPAGAAIDMSADAYCREQYDEAVMDRPVRVGSGGGLADVLVRVVNAPASGAAPEAEALLDQTGCLYTPGSVAVRVGQPLVIRNSDATLHNVRVVPASNAGFNLGQPLRGIQSTRSFETPEIGIPVRCDIHGWMTASIHVLEHEFFDITGEDGAFTLPMLPAGDYEIEAWHPTLGTVSGRVSVTADGAAPLTLDFSPSQGLSPPRTGSRG